MSITVASTKRAGFEVSRSKRSGAIHKILLSAGIISSLWYVAMNIYVPTQFPGYSSFSQTVSELSAIGAPTRILWSVLGIIFILTITSFGCGIFLSAGKSRPLKITGILLILYGLICVFWPPMHQRDVLAAGGKSITDTLHIAFTMVTGLIMMLAMAFGAAAFRKTFGFYSIATIVVLVVFGVITGFYAPSLEANLPTPWMGVWERVNIYATMLWLLVLAVKMLRGEIRSASSVSVLHSV